jgi:hypothetical protein
MDDLPEDAALLNGAHSLAQARAELSAAYRRPDVIKKLTALAAVAVYAEALSEALGKQQKIVDALAESLLTDVIPEIMEDSGLDSFALSDNSSIKLKDDVKAAISHANRLDALEALIEIDQGDVIKWGLAISIDRGTSVTDVQAARSALGDLGFPTSDVSTVHAQTLCALARELLAEGYDLSQPTPAMAERGDERSLASLLSLFIRQRAAIVTAKGKGGGKKKSA